MSDKSCTCGGSERELLLGILDDVSKKVHDPEDLFEMLQELGVSAEHAEELLALMEDAAIERAK
jgi:hypothetical protein